MKKTDIQCHMTFGIQRFAILINTYRAHLAKVEKTNKKGKTTIPVINLNLSFETKKIHNNHSK